MYLLEKPKYFIENYFKDMLKGRHDNAKNKFLITRLLLAEPKLIDEEKKYKFLAEKQELHNVIQRDFINITSTMELKDSLPKTINDKEMEKVYTNFLLDKPDSTKIGRDVYNTILANSYYNLCPYCSHRDIKTIDHYLPKSKFSYFTITPINLVPCCSDCNKAKSDDSTLIEENMLIHPYFDDISLIDWLKCEVVDNIWPITFSYKVSDNITNKVLRSRINYQFKLLGLSKLYADNATRKFRKRSNKLVKEYNSNPSNMAYDFLDDNYESCHSVNPNLWETRMYEALKNSNWFIKEALPDVQNFYENM